MIEIKIECQGAEDLRVDTLEDFQGDFKKMRKAEMVRLQRNIINNGFSDPVLVWKTRAGKNNIIDGHQRIKALRDLERNGFEGDKVKIPKALPVSYMNAKSAAVARRKLLGVDSRFSTVTKKGFRKFSDGLDLDVIMDEVKIENIELKIDDGADLQFTTELLESHNYIVLYFDNDIDWQTARDVFGVKEVKGLGSRKGKRISKRGLGRIVRGADVIEKIN